MIRLHFVVEGKTEKTFVDEVLGPELANSGVFADARLVQTGRRGTKRYRGGSLKYTHWKRDLTFWMKQDSAAEARYTSMIDLFRLPNDFPGYDQCKGIPDPHQRVAQLEQDSGDQRFIAYIQLHEFETLLFTDVSAFIVAFPAEPNCIRQLEAVRQQFPLVELINDGPHTAPSKRIVAILPSYDKDRAGSIIAKQIGLARMCSESQHFHQWFERLKGLDQATTTP